MARKKKDFLISCKKVGSSLIIEWRNYRDTIHFETEKGLYKYVYKMALPVDGEVTV